MTKNITPRQKEIFDFLFQFTEERGYPPTIREIASHFRIISLNAVRVHLKALERKKLITVENSRSRGIHIHNSYSPEGQLPIVGRIAAGTPMAAVEEKEDLVSLDGSFWGSADSPLYLLKVKGDSMDPEIQDGDLVVVRHQRHALPGDIVVALIEGEATVKKLVRRPGGDFVLHPLNPSYQDIEPGERLALSGKVVGIIRKY
ncbi:MAG: transcriptional repressor LexA [Candidatus Eremiobacteraeota bacterium]|nr:transcriptional repressor LexA [Candidatus Eremiobacteraeota bacterium]